ncbi:MAG: glycoside hydrolase family 172 protein, partial [Flavitalea sp.]
LFASPEGRSFNCFIPMPFRKSARIVITNESSKTLNHIFFDINYQLTTSWHNDNMYFHAYWHRDTATELTKDFELLPPVSGKGRLLGINAGINANPVYGDTWWGEGEVKAYIDGDKDLPTLVGTGTEDYIGDAWGQSSFVNNYTGCLIADDKKKQWSFYRYHIPDPIFFRKHFRMTLQQIGSSERKTALALNLPPSLFIPTTIDDGKGNITHLFAERKPLNENPGKIDYALFYRSDDMCSTAYFYLDKPYSELPQIQPLPERIYNLKPEKE